VVAASVVGVGDGGVYDLDEVGHGNSSVVLTVEFKHYVCVLGLAAHC